MPWKRPKEIAKRQKKQKTKNLYLSVHSSVIQNKQRVETTQMSINWWMDKQMWLNLYNGILFINKRNEELEFSWSTAVVKDLALSLQQLGTLLWFKFDPWPGNFRVLRVWPKIKKNKKKRNEVLIQATIWMRYAWKDYTKWKKPATKDHMLYNSIYRKCPE